MILFFTSGYSLGDYISANGWRKAARLVFKDCSLGWQMLGVDLIHFLTRSRNLHVLVGTNGFVLDRQFLADALTTYETAFKRSDMQGFVEVPNSGFHIQAWLRQNPRKPRGLLKTTIGYLVLWSTFGRVRCILGEDCITTAKKFLAVAGIPVPSTVWTANGLIEYLGSVGYRFENQGSLE
jgi:hypothetical protein